VPRQQAKHPTHPSVLHIHLARMACILMGTDRGMGDLHDGYWPKGFTINRNWGLTKEQAGVIADKLLNACTLDGGECGTCGRLVCPSGDPMHFHHDGCPTCAEIEDGNRATDG
jgi:hypothetical protein